VGAAADFILGHKQGTPKNQKQDINEEGRNQQLGWFADPRPAWIWPATKTHSWVLPAVGLLHLHIGSCSGGSIFWFFMMGLLRFGLVFWFFLCFLHGSNDF
jgi:hypothetical protein